MSTADNASKTPKFDKWQIMLYTRLGLDRPPVSPGFSIKGGPENPPNKNNGTYLILLYAANEKLSVKNTLIYFAEYRDYVTKNPGLNDHGNLRTLMSLPLDSQVSEIFSLTQQADLATQ